MIFRTFYHDGSAPTVRRLRDIYNGPKAGFKFAPPMTAMLDTPERLLARAQVWIADVPDDHRPVGCAPSFRLFKVPNRYPKTCLHFHYEDLYFV